MDVRTKLPFSNSNASLGVFTLAAIAAINGMPEAQAAIGAGDKGAPAPSFSDENLIDAMARTLGLETQAASHLVEWKVAQVSPYPGKETTSDVGGSRLGQLISNRILSQVLLGANEQVNCANCVSAFGSAGSYSAGAHGRYNFNNYLSFRGGVALSEYHGRGYKTTSAPILAGAFRLDLSDWGWSRPFIDAGVVASPSQDFRLRREYLDNFIPAVGTGRTHGHSISGFVKAGWVFRASPRDEVAIYGELWRSWQHVQAYTEVASSGPNTFIPSTADRTSIGKIGAQWTHLWGASFETHVNAGVSRTFDTRTGLLPVLAGMRSPAPPLRERTYLEYGLRVGYRFTPKLVLDVFANGAAGAGGGVDQVHVGTALRFSY